jgi:hypothetical protein
VSWSFYWYDRVGLDGNSVDGQEARTNSFNMNVPPFSVKFRTLVGAGSPPFQFIDEPIPLHAGSDLKFVDTLENEVDLMLTIRALTQTQLYQIISGSRTNGVSLTNMFSPTHIDQQVTLNSPPAPANTRRTLTGNGRLRIHSPGLGTYRDGSVDKQIYRDLICRCMTGFRIEESSLGYRSAFIPLTFRANQPYWRKHPIDGFSITNGSPTQTWFRVMNVDIGSGDQFNKVIQPRIGGDVATPFILRIRGACANPFIRNLTTGKEMRFRNLVIGRNETLVINVERKTVNIEGGENKFRNLDVSSQFFYLETGRNDLNVRLEAHPVHGITTQTRADFTYHERYTGVY